MLYGDEKVKTIARSVLPAGRRTARTVRRQKQRWNQTTRRRMDRDMWNGISRGMSSTDVVEAWEANPSCWLDAYTTKERDDMDYIRAYRREADKLGPVRQWTRSHVAHFEDRYELIEFVQRTLPDNLAGRHALGHMDSEFGPKSLSRYRGAGQREHNRFLAACRYAQGLSDLEEILVSSHDELNRRIRYTHTHSLLCHRAFRTYEKPVPPLKSWQNPIRYCLGRIVLTPDNFYRPKVACPKCSTLLSNNNLRPISTRSDLPGFIARLNPHSHAKLIEWIAEEVARQKSFARQPERHERRKALVSLSGHVLVA